MYNTLLPKFLTLYTSSLRLYLSNAKKQPHRRRILSLFQRADRSSLFFQSRKKSCLEILAKIISLTFVRNKFARCSVRERKEIPIDTHRERVRGTKGIFTVVLTRACPDPELPGVVWPSAWGRRCCCSWIEPRPRPGKPPGSRDEGADERSSAAAEVEEDRIVLRRPRNEEPPGRRRNLLRSRYPRHPASGGAASKLAGTAPLDRVPSSSEGCVVPAPFHLLPLWFYRVNCFESWLAWFCFRGWKNGNIRVISRRTFVQLTLVLATLRPSVLEPHLNPRLAQTESLA